MMRLWRRLPSAGKRVVLLVGLVIVPVATSQVVLWRFAQDQKSNLRLLSPAPISTGPPPSCCRRELLDATPARDVDLVAESAARRRSLTLPS